MSDKKDPKTQADEQRVQFKFDFGGDPSNDPAFDPAFAPRDDEEQTVVVKPVKKKEKKDTVAETLAQLPAGVRTNVKLLQDLQEEQSKILEQRDKELQQIMLKFDKLQDPLWQKRKNIVAGQETGSSKEGVPEFWLKALQNNPEIKETIEDHDELCLRHLVDIQTLALEDKKGFKIQFFFSENEYFTNTMLVKQYELGSYDDMLENVSGCKIDWKKGKNLTVKLQKKTKGKGKNARVVKKEKPRDSFFRFFAPPSLDLVEELEDMDDFDLSELIEADLQLGQTIRHVVQNGVRWFDSSALAEFDSDDDDDDDFDDIEGMDKLGIDDDDESSESDSDDEDGTGQIKKGPNQEEQCKQQ